MKHSTVDNRQALPVPRLQRERVTVLSGLPRPARVGVVVAVAVVVGVASLCQVGVLAPQFVTSGGGGGMPPLQAPPGTPPEQIPPQVQAAIVASQNSPQIEWSVLENVSLRHWEVTSADAPRGSGLDVVAFLEPADPSTGDYPGRIAAAASDPVLSRLPLSVPGGGRLVVMSTRRPGVCASPGFARGRQRRVRFTVHISTPFGRRSVHPTQWIAAAPPCPA